MRIYLDDDEFLLCYNKISNCKGIDYISNDSISLNDWYDDLLSTPN
jgi:hypothetical protein